MSFDQLNPYLKAGATLSVALVVWGAASMGKAETSGFDLLRTHPDIHVMSPAECEDLDPATPPEKLRAHHQSESQLKKDSWIPDPAPSHAEPLDCSPQTLERDVIAAARSSGNSNGSAIAISSFFRRCGDRLSANSSSSIKALFAVSNVHYEICRHPNARRVSLKLANGDRVSGILALKPGTQPRPLVIYKCGVYCNSRTAGLTFMMMHLFDESPFHVLALASTTGYEFIADNHYFGLGGLIEGQHMVFAADLMKRTALGPRFSSLHAAGVSLGGHAALFASRQRSSGTAMSCSAESRISP